MTIERKIYSLDHFNITYDKFLRGNYKCHIGFSIDWTEFPKLKHYSQAQRREMTVKSFNKNFEKVKAKYKAKFKAIMGADDYPISVEGYFTSKQVCELAKEKFVTVVSLHKITGLKKKKFPRVDTWFTVPIDYMVQKEKKKGGKTTYKTLHLMMKAPNREKAVDKARKYSKSYIEYEMIQPDLSFSRHKLIKVHEPQYAFSEIYEGATPYKNTVQKPFRKEDYWDGPKRK